MHLKVLLPILSLAFLAADVALAKRKLKVLIYSSSFYSHMNFQGRLADLLVEAGHEVHFFIADMNPALAHVNGSAKAQRIIRLPMPRAQKELESVDFMNNPFNGVNSMLLDGSQERLHTWMKLECLDFLEHESMLQQLTSEKYDLALAETWDPCAFGLFHAMSIPTRIATLAIPQDSNLARFLGIPQPPSFVPILAASTVSGDQMSYLERARNFLLHAYESFWIAPNLANTINPVFRERFGSSFPDIREIVANVSLAFVNANEFFDLAKPISHKVINIGGVVEKKPKALTKDLQEVFADAKDGVVLFSFGSITDTTKMSNEMKLAFLDAFARFPDTNFIWKLETTGNDSQLLDRFPNVHVVDWLDQVSILAHPKTRAFITHCGLNSLNEASAHGVPLVAIPLFGDQLYNAAIVQKKQTGVYLDIREVTEKSVYDALDKVLNDPSYRERSLLVKRKLQSAPFTAAEKFVKWTEFAAEFSDLDELSLAGVRMNVFVYHSLDVIIPLLAALVAAIAFTYTILRVAARCVFNLVALKRKLD